MVTVTITDKNLIRQLQKMAEREGKTVTDVIIDAVTERTNLSDLTVDPHSSQDRDRYWADFGDRMRAENPDWDPHADVEALYDPETGLPT